MTTLFNTLYNFMSESKTEEAAAVTQPEGQYAWKIHDQSLLNQIMSATNGEKFQSDDFKMADLNWKIEIQPNGMNADRVGSFDVFLSLLHRPPQWKELIINFTIQSPQTQSSYVDMVTYKEGKMSIGWSAFTLSLEELKETKYDGLIFIVSVKIIKIILINDTIHYKSTFPYKSTQTIQHYINADIMNSFKKCHFGKGCFSPIKNQMFSIGVYPDGVGWDKSTCSWYMLYLSQIMCIS